jgi:hypothetical protein
VAEKPTAPRTLNVNLIGREALMNYLTKSLLLFLTGITTVYAQTGSYVSPKVGTEYHFTSSANGEGINKVLSTKGDSYEVETTLKEQKPLKGQRLLGVLSMPESTGISSQESEKVAKILPLRVGNKVGFKSFGTTGSAQWNRDHQWEVLSEYETKIAAKAEKIYVLKLKAETPGFYKYEGTCDFSPTYAVCLRSSGEQFVANRPALTGPLSVNIRKIRLDNVDIAIPPR